MCTYLDMSSSYVRVRNCDKQGRRRMERQRMSKNSIASDKAV